MDSKVPLEGKVDESEDLHDGMMDDEDGDSDTPEAEGGVSRTEDSTIPVKRKGGRKPIYATSEERKQRNRQAQAAFRERRTEYIKQLEDALQVMEANLNNLQTAHRNAADEVLMLRYKNSLLERILMEKGIDVQAELRAKTGSPTLGPVHTAPNMIQAPTAHRAMMNRHHQARRSTSHIAPKLESASSQGNPSPRPSRPTSVAQHPSPAASSPGYALQGPMAPSPAESAMSFQRSHQSNKPHMPHGLANLPGAMMLQQASLPVKSPGNGGSSLQSPPAPSPYYQPSYQGPAYGTPSTIGDVHSPQNVPSHYVPQNMPQRPPMQPHHVFDSGPQQTPQSQQQPQSQQHQQFGNNTNTMMYPFDTAMEADPFGLTASMTFPTHY